MNVIMRHEISGTRNNAYWPKRGETLECSDVEGADLIRVGFASPVETADAPVETADADAPVETAAVVTVPVPGPVTTKSVATPV